MRIHIVKDAVSHRALDPCFQRKAGTVTAGFTSTLDHWHNHSALEDAASTDGGYSPLEWADRVGERSSVQGRKSSNVSEMSKQKKKSAFS